MIFLRVWFHSLIRTFSKHSHAMCRVEDLSGCVHFCECGYHPYKTRKQIAMVNYGLSGISKLRKMFKSTNGNITAEDSLKPQSSSSLPTQERTK